MPHFDWSISLGNLIIGIPMLGILLKMYGDWRVIKYRINIMWAEYCNTHKILSISDTMD